MTAVLSMVLVNLLSSIITLTTYRKRTTKRTAAFQDPQKWAVNEPVLDFFLILFT